MVVGALIREVEDGTRMIDWYTAVADDLNNPPSLNYTRTMLRSIEETWRRGDEIRRRERYERTHPRPKHFGADFGRLDFSEPGQGGHGYDDGDGGY
jgi:hypothetical protein